MMSNRHDFEEELNTINYLFGTRRNDPDTALSETETVTETDTEGVEGQVRAAEPERGTNVDWDSEEFMAPRLSYKDHTFDVLTRPSVPLVRHSPLLGAEAFQLRDSRMRSHLHDDESPRQVVVLGNPLRNFLPISEPGLWEAFTKDTSIALDDDSAEEELLAPRRAALPRCRPASAPPLIRPLEPLQPLSLLKATLSRSRAPFSSALIDEALGHRRGERSHSHGHLNTFDDDLASSIYPDESSVDVFAPARTTTVVTTTMATATAPNSICAALNTPSTLCFQSLKGGCSDETTDIAALVPKVMGPVVKGPQPHHLFIPAWVFTARARDTEVFDNTIYYYFEHNRWPNYTELPERFQIDCEETNTSPDAYHKTVDGFAPVWMFVLNRLGEDKPAFRTWFVGCVAVFFEDGSFPASYMFPKQLEAVCAHLGIDEDDFYKEEGFPED